MSKILSAATAAGFVAFAAVASAPASAVTLGSVYNFTGVCQESAACSGEAHATLTLVDYVYGQEFTKDNFVSFDYDASNVSFTIEHDGLGEDAWDFSGHFASFFIFPAHNVYVGGTDTNGVERSFYAFDFGDYGWYTDDTTRGSGFQHTWESDSFPTASPAPEPASWAMMLGGFGLLGASLRSRRSNVRFA